MTIIIDPETKNEIDFNIALIKRLDKIFVSIQQNAYQLRSITRVIEELNLIIDEDLVEKRNIQKSLKKIS